MIAEFGTIFIVMAIVFGVFMTWGIGANDVANALGPSVGSGAITIKTAIVIAAIFEFAGAGIAGGHVTETIRKDIIDPSTLDQRDGDLKIPRDSPGSLRPVFLPNPKAFMY